jgi:SAM-dependent methyltransferase
LTDAYRAFLEAKVRLAPRQGFDLAAEAINPAMKPVARAVAHWALGGGRRAIFASFGLHKTSMQLELMRQIGLATDRPTLIVMPLDVRHEFFAEVAARGFAGLGMQCKFIRSTAEIEDADVTHFTNYESVREGKIDVSRFVGASLDEAAILRGFGGSKTFREFMRLFEGVKYRFVATATPSPNDYIELLAYAAFLDIMDVGEAKTRFFKRDSANADKLTLHPHKEREFWLWCASWAIFIQKPSDLGYSDEGYDLPALDIRWHELPVDHAGAGEERDGQARMFRNAAAGIVEAAREKRDSLDLRMARLAQIRAEAPAEHRILWHDLEIERKAIEAAVPGVVSVYGAQDPEERAAAVRDFSEGRIAELAGKPVMLGSGCNFQKHCAWEVFLGIGFKFKDMIQAIHRLQRFGQTRTVRVDFIYTESEREVRRALETKWEDHKRLMARMGEIIREFGLANAAAASTLARSIGVARQERSGEGWRLVNNDCVEETRGMAADSVDLIVTSIPFSTQYEYTPSYNDFGHTDDNAHFWAQMDFLIPELLRVLKPGRNTCIHVKDRIAPGGLTGLGFQTVQRFSDECAGAFERHGFAFLARKTITTDVVRENNQTYRLGWSEQCKDGTRMGAGMPEYLLVFRKPPSDRSNGYADVPVVKDKPLCLDEAGEARPFDARTNWRRPVPGTGYSRAQWQLDAHGYARSSGDRLLSSDELRAMPHEQIFKWWRAYNLGGVYDAREHARLGEEIDLTERLPATFMLLPPHSPHEDVWTDVTRMRTLNGAQSAAGREMHLCPLQFDIVERAIVQMSMAGETVFDPFGGLMTVPYCAVKLGRRGLGVELNPRYFRDGVAYVEAAAREAAVPTLFDLLALREAAE